MGSVNGIVKSAGEMESRSGKQIGEGIRAGKHKTGLGQDILFSDSGKCNRERNMGAGLRKRIGKMNR